MFCIPKFQVVVLEKLSWAWKSKNASQHRHIESIEAVWKWKQKHNWKCCRTSYEKDF